MVLLCNVVMVFLSVEAALMEVKIGRLLSGLVVGQVAALHQLVLLLHLLTWQLPQIIPASNAPYLVHQTSIILLALGVFVIICVPGVSCCGLLDTAGSLVNNLRLPTTPTLLSRITHCLTPVYISLQKHHFFSFIYQWLPIQITKSFAN